MHPKGPLISVVSCTKQVCEQGTQDLEAPVESFVFSVRHGVLQSFLHPRVCDVKPQASSATPNQCSISSLWAWSKAGHLEKRLHSLSESGGVTQPSTVGHSSPYLKFFWLRCGPNPKSNVANVARPSPQSFTIST